MFSINIWKIRYRKTAYRYRESNLWFQRFSVPVAVIFAGDVDT